MTDTLTDRFLLLMQFWQKTKIRYKNVTDNLKSFYRMFSSKEHIPLILCSTRPVTVCFGNGLFAIRYSQSQAIEQIRVALFDEVVTL